MGYLDTAKKILRGRQSTEHPKLPPYDLVEVSWVDTHVLHGWRDPEEIPIHPATIWSVGYLVDERDVGIILCPVIGVDDPTDHEGVGVQCPTFIPRETIKSQVTLRKYNDGSDTQKH